MAEWIETMQQPVTTAQSEILVPPVGEGAARTTVAVFLPLHSWLTVERGAYIGLALLALVLRLANLGAHPLSDAEAGQALVPWRIYQGQAVDQVGYSPLVATLNLLSFLALGGSEFTARLGPAVLGMALVLLPYGLRSHLGRAGALATSVLLAISPTALYFSRTVNGDIGVAVGGLALVVGLFGWLDLHFSPRISKLSSSASTLYLAAGGLALMLTAAPSAYSTLVLLLGFLALATAVGGKGYAASAREGLAALRTRLVGLGNFGLALVGVLLAAATGLLFNLGGLAATADLLTTWLLGFAPFAATPGVYPAVFLLSLYEPLILLPGLFGMAVSLLRRRLMDLFLGWWFFGSIALNLLRSGRTDGEVLVPMVPLTLLAGLALGMLWDSLREEGNWQKEGILAGVGLIISGYAYISLMSYTRSGGVTFWLPVAGVGLFVLLVALFGIWYEWASSLRGAALAALVVLLVFTIASASRLNNPLFTTVAGSRVVDPRQPLARAPAAEGLPALMSTLRQLSSWQAGDPYLIDIIADRRLGPAVEWQLRRFPNVTWTDGLNSWPPPASADRSDASPEPARQLGEFSAILAPADVSLPLENGYVGQDFAVRAFWSPAGLRGQSLIRWIVLRTATSPASVERLVLWVEGPQGPAIEAQEKTAGEAIR